MLVSDGDRLQMGKRATDRWIALVYLAVNDPRRGGFPPETFQRWRQPIEPLSGT